MGVNFKVRHRGPKQVWKCVKIDSVRRRLLEFIHGEVLKSIRMSRIYYSRMNKWGSMSFQVEMDKSLRKLLDQLISSLLDLFIEIEFRLDMH